MSLLYTELDNRKLPELKPQNEMIEILQREVYGYLPNVEYSITVNDARVLESRYSRGTVTHSIVNLTIRTARGEHTFRVAIAGHSRLGKTALVTAMMDRRIRYTFSNAAGCSGDSLARGNSGLARTFTRDTSKGELIEDIVKMFPYWFCKNYYKYTETNIPEEFDQHYLPATLAPRYVMIGSCSLDYWADPKSQQLCALAAGQAWEELGLDGLVDGAERYIESGESLTDGHVGYFKLEMPHFLSRHGWKWFIRFIEKHE